MKLKSALKKAMSLLPKDKGTVFYKVRFIKSPSSIFVTDGLCSSVVKVDDDIFDFLCEASVLVNAVKDKGDFSFTVEGDGSVKLNTDSNSYTLIGEDISSFPSPIFSDGSLFGDADILGLNNVIYAASKTAKNDGLPYIHFTNTYVEATDRVRLAKFLIDFPWEGLLPVDLFNKWPKKASSIGFYFDGYRCFFMIGDEVRYAFPLGDKYPDTTVATTLGDNKSCVVVSRKSLLETIKQASEVSKISGVLLSFGETLEVRALDRESVSYAYLGYVMTEGEGTGCDVSVSGKSLSQCLRNIKSSEISCYYGEYPSPLVLRGGDTLVYIWPMFNG